MDDCAGAFPGTVVPGDAALEREFRERLAESSTLVLRVAYSVVRNREDAEDIAQDACVRAYRQFSRLRDRDRFRAWLVRITWRLAIDRSRARQRRAAREQWVETREARTAEQVAQDRERTTLLWQAIDNLAPKLRIVVILAAIKGHDVGEVARLLQLPEGTVKSRLFLARRKLAEKLQCLANDLPER